MMIYDDPKGWLECLPWAELWFNSSFNSVIGMPSFMTLYGREAPIMPEYRPPQSQIIEVDQDLQRRSKIIAMVKKIWKEFGNT